MSLKNEMAASIREVQKALPKTCTIAGQTYSCLVGEPMLSEDMQDGGFMPSVTTPLKIIRDDLATIPTVGTLVLHNGKKYEIEGIADRPEHPQVVFNLRLKNEA